MTVYVESNFVLELALGQEQVSAAEAILASAERQEIALAVPWFSLAEPFSTVDKRSRDRKQFIGQLGRQLRDLQRSQDREEVVRSLAFGSVLLEQIDSAEQENLIKVAERILNTATILPVDAPAFGRAMNYRSMFGFSLQDALVYAAVVGDLMNDASPGPHYFVTRDHDDFQDPGIADELRALDCEILLSFPALAVILERREPG